MTGLLISVRNAEEAATALAGGVDILDIKEPALGPLGAASPEIWRQVHAVCGKCVPTSVALGELCEVEGRLDLETLAPFDYAKVGLADCSSRSDWQRRWRNLVEILAHSVTPVAVVYADWQDCNAPTPREVIHQALLTRCGVVLFDTCIKANGNLFTHIPQEQLLRMITDIRSAGLSVVLGGSLDETSIVNAHGLQPDYVAVRGAACRGTRTGAIDLQRVRRLSALLRGVPTSVHGKSLNTSRTLRSRARGNTRTE